jgi:sarcosine oxidase subunit alpha
VIDRGRSLTFTWNGRSFTGLAGDTIVSALAAAGERVFSRSYKYHRPRGLLTATMHDPGCLLQVDHEPNVRGAHRLLREGMAVSSQNTWPSLRFDVKAVNQLGGRFLAPGFYYKTFMEPASLWPTYEAVLRQFVHAGTNHPVPDGTRYEKRYAHTDVLVVGGGIAGMHAALAAARAGARVMLVEEEHRLGGHLRWEDPQAAATLAEEVVATEGITVLTDATVTARYDDNWCAVVQRDPEPGMPERLLKTRAGAVVVAVGLIERPYVFEGNDLPGIMLSTAARRLIALHAVRPGERAVVLSANDEGDAAARDLEAAGVEIAALVDPRSRGGLVRARGRGGVREVELADGTRVEADLLVTATGWTAPTSLLNMAGDVPVYAPEAARFLPGGQAAGGGVLAAGGIAGDGSPEQLADHGTAVGSAAAAHALGRGTTSVPALPRPTHPALFRSSTHGMVDFSEDVSSKDLVSAVREGYDSAELAKRYTTLTMGPTQGKLELVNALAVIAEATGRPLAEVGVTTWRPMYTSVTLGALAGRHHDPVRVSPMQPWHEAHGAVPMVAGQWIRPEHYGDPAAEVRAVREGVGLIDVTPIGAFDLQGPDVPKLLNQLYVNRWSKLAVGRVRYGVMCAEDGVVLDDGVTAHLDEDRYLMTTTSSGAGSIWEWIEEWLQTVHPEWQVHATPLTTSFASINVAGPHSRRLVSRLAEGVDLGADAFGYMSARTGTIAGVPDCVLMRIGFTGELSYELRVPAAYGLHVWERLMEAGSDLGVTAFGVEAQRVLRLEKGHLIVGQDTDGLTKAYSAGLGGLVKLDKPDFAGRPELAWQEQSGDGPRLVAIQPEDPELVPPEASQILTGPGRIGGRITSSRLSPTLGRSVCLGQVDQRLAAPGTMLDVRLPDGRDVRATVMPQLAHVDPDGERLDNDSAPEEPLASTAPVARAVVEGRAGIGTGAGAGAGTAPAAPLTLAEAVGAAAVNLRASEDGEVAAELDTPFGRTRRIDAGLLDGSGPGEWLLLGGPDGASAAAEHLRAVAGRAAEHASVVDISHGRAVFRLAGDAAAELLGAVCAIDLDGERVPDGAALRTSVAGVVADLVRCDADGVRGYLLHCERSSGRYLHETLLDAGESLGAVAGEAVDLGRVTA